MTEAGTSGIPVIGRKAGGRRLVVSDMCLHKERSCRIGGKPSVAVRFWYLPLGAVLKREEKGIWWMPWH